MESTLSSQEALTQIELSQIRKVIRPEAYKRSMPITVFWCVFDLSLYVFFIAGALTVNQWYIKILFGILAGITASSMFNLAHDMAHGALFKNKLLSEILGTLYMLPALHVYRAWCVGHNRVHHGYTSFGPLDWIWRPLTQNEYSNLSRVKKFLYRIERSFCGCGLHYLIKVWWAKMVFYVPEGFKAQDKRYAFFSKSCIAIFVAVMTVIGYYNAGITGFFSVLILPFLVFNYIIAFNVYLHHTHPDLPFFDNSDEWSHSIGALFCTTVFHGHWFFEKVISHNILIHTPHHVDFRIPFYRVKTALADIRKEYGQYLHEYRLSLPVVLAIFRRCKLYDYERRTWHDFKN